MQKNKTKIFCTFNFGPINMAKAWIKSENNFNIIKNELSR